MPDIIPSTLFGHWVHSREEDSGDQMIFRPVNFSFPPARGRDALEFLAHHVMIDRSIAPADGNQSLRKYWDLNSSGEIRVFNSEKLPTPDRILQIVSASPDHLVIKSGT